MKRKFFSTIALGLILGSCVSTPKSKMTNSDNPESAMAEENKEKTICKKEPKSEAVEVLYFHNDDRCETCEAIERLTTEVINSKFSKELNNGKLQLSIIDFSTTEGEKIANMYEVTKTTLFINKWYGGTVSCDNLTEYGFATATTNPEEYKLQIEAKLTMLLKA